MLASDWSIERGGRGERGCFEANLSVLDGELDGHVNALPVHSGVSDVLTDLLGRLKADQQQDKHMC